MNAEAIPAVASVTLSPEEIADRIAAYRGDGSFERDMAETWTRAGDIIAAVIRENGSRILAMLSLPQAGAIPGGSETFIEHIIDTLAPLFTGRVDRDWVLTLAGRGAAIDRDGHSMPVIIAERANEYAAMTARLTAAFADDPAFVQRAISTMQRLYSYDTEIALAQIGATRRAEATAALSGESIRFRDEIGAILSSAVKDADQLRGQTAAASSSARGMLGKTSEVAAAAEQSAVAMREAAQTAAGLIRAIEEARSEVEVAAGVATRAADQSGAAVAVSEALSGHAQAIESILGLIRDIAGQTNLLALNATIEAARAGDAGRGFAVVAQEVKSLASQTARATDDIAAKITAIQTATRQTLDANGSIRDIVGEVQASAQRIREAMEAQAHTVTMITAAVDETALAADSMSGTIAAIRTDTESVASEIDALGESFRVVDKQMGRLEQTTGSFVEKIAA